MLHASMTQDVLEQLVKSVNKLPHLPPSLSSFIFLLFFILLLNCSRQGPIWDLGVPPPHWSLAQAGTNERPLEVKNRC